ncbi:MAG: protoglobin domain-containing protein [Desulfosudis oleivorans]|nr:protoglobin domain-containing protein [Desulfosudis oleivorans]
MPGVLKRTWSSWFEAFFSADFDDRFLSWLWKIGVRHVEVNLDQRFSNLGFAIIRQFCHGIVLKEVPLEMRGPILSIIDKLIDLCVLVETSAYIENTTSCDIEVMREMADRVRNPAMIIGWNIKRLQDKVSIGQQRVQGVQNAYGGKPEARRDGEGYQGLYGPFPG